MYEKILIANDGSDGAAKALAVAIKMAHRPKVKLDMVCVEEMPYAPATIDEVVEERLEENHRFEKVIEHARLQARAAHVKFETHVVAGHAVPSIIEFIERGGFDLLVIGYMGHSAIYNRLIGSTTDRLVELAPCHVLVVK
ncbi:universal stress protein [Mesorhizobium tianshanense]|uniref:Nucleotide-binding universal stress UspA family protein n=1 Tax=Mesorhizobium tianshanense TaxID=39844 RepID=A0A562MC84_9HYPH|nr:universal stress protein [Mesorhizobium tianshanense]TWI17442.1 nucleotide-binding universal stress UspA family protein [Mesorhizobium tianshanense]GLS37184.1 universal stress protein [Mesorhizobium tianshanense]